MSSETRINNGDGTYTVIKETDSSITERAYEKSSLGSVRDIMSNDKMVSSSKTSK